MSHSVVLVNVGDTEHVEDEVERLMKPYDENGEWFKEGSKWDWYVIGGRWDNHYGSNILSPAELLTLPEAQWPGHVLDHSEGWFEFAEMGWFGHNAALDKNEEWIKRLRKYLESLPEGDKLVVVDYHV